METTTMHKVKYLEGLRGIAACIVVVHHVVLAFYPALFTGSVVNVRTLNGLEVFLSGTPLNILYGGTFCVSIFFTLSGYVLSYRFFRDGSRDALMSSAARRYFRLVMPVAAAVFLAYLCMKLSLFSNGEAARLTTSGWLATWWTFTPDMFDMLRQAFFGSLFLHEYSYNNVLWIMTFEMYGSLLILGLLALFGRLQMRLLFFTAAAVLLYRTYYLSFILGLMLSDLQNDPKKRFSALSKPVFIAVMLLAALFFGSYPPGRTSIAGTVYRYLPIDVGFPAPFMIYHIAGSALLLAAILLSDRLQRMLDNRICTYFGGISFSLYLTHLIVLFTFSCFVFARVYPVLGYGAAVLLTSVLSVPVMLIAAQALSRYVDAPSVKLSAKIYRVFLEGHGALLRAR